GWGGGGVAAGPAAPARPAAGPGVALTPLDRRDDGDGGATYAHVRVTVDRAAGAAHVTVAAPTGAEPATPEELVAAGAGAWVLAAARELDDAALHLRFDDPELGTWILHTTGDPGAVAA